MSMGTVLGLNVVHSMPIVFAVVFLMTSLNIVDRVLTAFKKQNSIGDSLSVQERHRVFNLFFQRFECLKEEIVSHLGAAHDYNLQANKTRAQNSEIIVSEEHLEVQLASGNP
jgi:hypothetical protein